MKILYVYSDYKWTGPSQPIVELCNFMSKRADVGLLTCAPKTSNPGLTSRVNHDKIKIYQGLIKQGGLGAMIKNKKLVTKCSHQFNPDIIHFFRERDFAMSSDGSFKSKKIFTDFKVRYPGLLNRLIWKSADIVTVFSKKLQNSLQQSLKNTLYIKPWLDLQQIPTQWKNIRSEFGLSDEDFIVGLVMRVQQHRRFDLVIEVAKIIQQTGKKIKLLLLGRGSKMNSIAVSPIKKNNLEDVLIFGGYKSLDYWDAIHCFDVMFYTVAGSDGTARALRQCQCIGKPVICLKSDFAEEIIQNGINGYIVQENSQTIAEKIITLYSNKELCNEFSKKSFMQSKQYDLENIGQEIYHLYENHMK